MRGSYCMLMSPPNVRWWEDSETAGNSQLSKSAGDFQRPLHLRGEDLETAMPGTTTEIALRLDPRACPQSHVGPRACMLHLFDETHGFVSHTSQIGRFAGPYPFA
jgi:hypothetical protein